MRPDSLFGTMHRNGCRMGTLATPACNDISGAAAAEERQEGVELVGLVGDRRAPPGIWGFPVRRSPCRRRS
uniref:Uncharacterized protein n=1 Tax=Arundo donax TaxID=35708 RepID=A0A0A9D643_ARUDO